MIMMVMIKPTAINAAIIRIPVNVRFWLSPVDAGSRPDAARAVTMGLYIMRVMAALRLYLMTLKGRMVGLSMATIAARGMPVYMGMIR